MNGARAYFGVSAAALMDNSPGPALIAGEWGNLYGTTTQGGTHPCQDVNESFNCGTAFELSPPPGNQAPWHERVLWNFGSSGDGISPGAALIADQRGNLYSTTTYGGANSCSADFPGCGTVFKLSPY
jgi:hypothetical protein